MASRKGPKRSPKKMVSDKDRKLILAYTGDIARKSLKSGGSRTPTAGQQQTGQFQPIHNEVLYGLYARPLTMCLMVGSHLENKVLTHQTLKGPTNQPIQLVRDVDSDSTGLIVVKLTDPQANVEASITIDTKFYGYYMDYLSETYEDVISCFRPRSVDWWVENIKNVLVISTEADGLVAIISKAKIEEIVSAYCTTKSDKSLAVESRDTIGEPQRNNRNRKPSITATVVSSSASVPILPPLSPRSAANNTDSNYNNLSDTLAAMQLASAAERPSSRRNQRSRGSMISYLGLGETLSFDARGNPVIASAAIDVPDCFSEEDNGRQGRADGNDNDQKIRGSTGDTLNSEYNDYQDCVPIKLPPIVGSINVSRQPSGSPLDNAETTPPLQQQTGESTDNYASAVAEAAPSDSRIKDTAVTVDNGVEVVAVNVDDEEKYDYEDVDDDEYSFESTSTPFTQDYHRYYEHSSDNAANSDEFYGYNNTIMIGFKKPPTKQEKEHKMVKMLRSERLVRRFIRKGRKMTTKDAKSLHRALTWTETKLLDSPYAKTQANYAKIFEGHEVLDETLQRLDSFVTDNEGAFRSAKDWNLREGLPLHHRSHHNNEAASHHVDISANHRHFDHDH
jgi:hypothetical protein